MRPLVGNRVLVLAAHMDDEALGVGGTIWTLAREGCEVTVCFAANRAYDHIYEDGAIAEEERCAIAAKDVLGYDGATFLRLQDERLPERAHELMVRLEDAMQAVKPETVFINHRGDVNQDHEALARAAMIAIRPHSTPFLNSVLAFEVPSSTDQIPQESYNAFRPNVYMALGEEAVRAKQDALACYARELRDYPHPRSPEGVEVFARKRGMECAASYAEAFRVLRARL